jgi:hypothetical protein
VCRGWLAGRTGDPTMLPYYAAFLLTVVILLDFPQPVYLLL